jgi:hypothetical protein
VCLFEVRRFSFTHFSRFVVEIKTISLKIRRLLEVLFVSSSVVIRWDEKTGLRRDAVRSQVIDVL